MAKRSTKQQLLLSAISLLLCVSMLVGSTFAWFTDSVTSTNNIIKSGTLDVSMEWLGDKADPNATDAAWKDASQGAIFDYSLWEPGYTQVRHVKIENEGTLALKYTVTITAYDENGAPLAPENVSKLADVIDVYYIDPAVAVTRDSIESLPDENKLGTLRDVLKGLNHTANGTLEKKGDSDIVTLALKMREEANNDYQNQSIGASFAVTLFATQLEYEGDSFDNKYDEDADYPASNSIFLAKKGDTGVVAEGDVRVAVTAPADATTFTLNVVDNGTTTDASGNTTAAYDIELLQNGAKAPAGSYEVTINVGSFLNVTEVTHNGTAVTPFAYNKITGDLTFITDSFSPFTVTYTVDDEGTAIPENTPVKDVIADAIENGETEVVVNANGSTLNLNYGINTSAVPEGTTVTLKNAFVEGKSYGNGVNGTLIFENCTFTNTGAYSIHFDNGTGDVIFNNCILEGWCSFGSTLNSVTMNDCTIRGNGKYALVRFYQNAELNNCIIDNTNAVHDDVYADGVSSVNHNGVVEPVQVKLNNCNIISADFERGISGNDVTIGGEIIIDGDYIVTDMADFEAAVASGKTPLVLTAGEYDLNGNQKDGLTIIGLGDGVNVANTTKYASGKAIGAIWKAINLENVTITNTVYTMADGGNATFKDVNFAAGFRQGYGKNVVFDGCEFGSNSEGYALHFQTDSASEGGNITLNECEFNGGKVHLGGKRAYTFTDCDFAAGTDFQVWSNITLDGCTVDGEAVTADNLNTLFPNLNAEKVTLK